MKSKVVIVWVLLFAVACNKSSEANKQLQRQVDRLEKQIQDTYTPGFGEFMGAIQTHHAKLWFAGINKNWQLADFEIHEINEVLEAIKKYQADRPETKYIEMLRPSMDSIAKAVNNKDSRLFKITYNQLTVSCNNCHRQTHFDFNYVKVPDEQIYSNQEFKVE